jgi:4-hydroxybenzoate polyprenyltransferase
MDLNKNDDNPVSRRALQIVFVAFMGLVVVATYWCGSNDPERSTLLCVSGVVLCVLFFCAFLAYFRPRGLPAFIVSTAWVGLLVIFGAYLAGTELSHFDNFWAKVLFFLVVAAWLVKGISAVRGDRD